MRRSRVGHIRRNYEAIFGGDSKDHKDHVKVGLLLKED